MTESVGSRLRTALAAKQWTQSDLVRETGIDKNTISAIANNRSQARTSTLDKIEEALGLTRGTLAGSGEDADEPGTPAAEHISLRRLAAKLHREIVEYEEVASEWYLSHERYQRRLWGLVEFAEHNGDDPVVSECMDRFWHLDSAEGMRRLTGREEDQLAEILFELESRMRAGRKDAGNAEAEKSPGGAVTPNVTPETQTLAARRGRSRGKALRDELDGLGEESQDGGEQE